MKSLLPTVLLALSLAAPALAQEGARETVAWSVSAPEDVQPGGKAALTVKGSVLDGWHVYSLKQAPNGPTPLVVGLAPNGVAKADGKAAESQPEKIHDAAFGLDTAYFSKAFTLTVPVRLKPGVKAGAQTIPINVRFQTCNGGICQPPKTVHLSAAINVQAAR
jgi:hypothetical protein